MRARLIGLLDDLEDIMMGGIRRPDERRTQIRSNTQAHLPEGAQPPSFASTPQQEAERRRTLRALDDEVRACHSCALHAGRTNAVPGIGPLDPLVMVIGEGPGAEEDARGEPFVGRAGRYLDKWLVALELSRTVNVYITNVVKCRPPGNRDPSPAESFACKPYLYRQIEVVRPRTILILGRVAARELLGRSEGIGVLRTHTLEFHGTPVVVTYHPSAVLRNSAWRTPVWEDLQRLQKMYADVE